VICLLEGRVVLEGEPASLSQSAISEAYFGNKVTGRTVTTTKGAS